MKSFPHLFRDTSSVLSFRLRLHQSLHRIQHVSLHPPLLLLDDPTQVRGVLLHRRLVLLVGPQRLVHEVHVGHRHVSISRGLLDLQLLQLCLVPPLLRCIQVFRDAPELTQLGTVPESNGAAVW